jgi:hypothetical protein
VTAGSRRVLLGSKTFVQPALNASTLPSALCTPVAYALLDMKAQSVPTRRSERVRKPRTPREVLKTGAVVSPAPQWCARGRFGLFLKLTHMQAREHAPATLRRYHSRPSDGWGASARPSQIALLALHGGSRHRDPGGHGACAAIQERESRIIIIPWLTIADLD